MSVINTNITSLIAQQNLGKSQNALQTSMERLSSGMRINSAKDDAAGQAIANRFTAQINGLNQAVRNSNDGISIAQTTEGSLNQINENLQSIRTLTVQAANGSNSESDLQSIQDEINQRLSEIDRISAETDFNGTRVLSEGAGSLRVQVGANDNQVIDIGLRQMDVSTLGLSGFNVDGSGVSDNTAATVTDVLANDGTIVTGTTLYDVTTEHDEAGLEDVIGLLSNGDTIAVSGGATYTYDAAAGNFTFTDESIDTLAKIGVLADSLTPSTGTASGQYELTGGDIVNFEVTSTGNITIGGQAARISDDGELTTNSGGGTLATLTSLLSDNNGTGNSTVTMGGTTYTLSGGSAAVSYTNTATSDQVLAQAEGNNTVTVQLSDGLLSATVEYDSDGNLSGGSSAYLDSAGNFTTTEHFTTRYNVDADSGEVTVVGTSASGGAFQATKPLENSEYAFEVGAQVFVSSEGALTTDTTSQGDRTEDPLATLDAALSNVDSLRSELGAVQNRFSDAITNLQTVSTNLQDARSRIEDADYAKEVAEMTRAQILQQAGTSVLAQANQLPQNVLSLLG